MKKLALLISMSILSVSASASLSDDMDDFFKSSGMQTNVTGAGAYQGQTAGLYTGGQLYARNRVRNIYPANIQLPSYSAGCGGIDAFTGSFSFISGKELVNSMESIASSAASYAFLLAMETVSPQMSGIQKHLSNMANAVNRANINSCEAASSLVGGLWPKTEVAQNHICTASGSSSGFLSDWAAAKQGCASGKTASTLSGKAKEKYGDMVFQNKNIAWEVLKKYPGDVDTETKELLMSISGTFISKNHGGDGEKNTFMNTRSLATDTDFIKALMHGGKVTIYKCNETKECLEPKPSEVTISAEESFSGMVVKTLNDIRDAIRDDRPLTQKEIQFLGSTTLPIYKMFNVEYAMGKDTDILNINSYASIIASDLFYQYLSENLELMKYASESLDLMDEFMSKYRQSIDEAKRHINQVRNESSINLNYTITLIKQTQLLEQALAGKLSSHLVNVIGYENGA